MMKNDKYQINSCINFRRMLLFLLLSFQIVASFSFAKDRTLANLVVNQHLEDNPFEQMKWSEKFFLQDKRGYLNKLKADFNEVEAKKEHFKRWGNIPFYSSREDHKIKSKYSKNMLKYLDKRISMQVKTADEGSGWHAVGKAQKGLKPKVSARLFNNVDLKVRGKILLGRIKFGLRNPYFENWLQVNYKGNFNFLLSKNFSKANIKFNAKYQVSEGKYNLEANKKITKNVALVLSSHKYNNQDRLSLGKDFKEKENVLNLVYKMPF